MHYLNGNKQGSKDKSVISDNKQTTRVFILNEKWLGKSLPIINIIITNSLPGQAVQVPL